MYISTHFCGNNFACCQNIFYEMKICPVCQKDDLVGIIKTEIGRRTYYCFRCNHSWKDQPEKKDEQEFNA